MALSPDKAGGVWSTARLYPTGVIARTTFSRQRHYSRYWAPLLILERSMSRDRFRFCQKSRIFGRWCLRLPRNHGDATP